MEIFGLTSFNLSEKDLTKSLLEVPMLVSVYNIYYPEQSVLKVLAPNQRWKIIAEQLRNKYKQLVSIWPSKDFERLGSVIKPRGVKGILTGKQILEVSKSGFIDWISVNEIPGKEKIEKVEEQFFSVKALFAAEVEGFDYSDSVQLLEERILLIKAFHRKEAIEKLKPEFEAYEEEHLNIDKRFVRWRFIEIQDVFEVGVSELDPNGTEIFSVMKHQKLKNAITGFSI